ncbi:PaaI family thioesterase [Amycolatopsis sp. K13G38]|uniref:Acyl-coenzyme A thioesterase THEM4 n=2 Tax=Amycolatopsis acididurans TaxID=2724524 RepID=A0ABX1JG35_9PSEU|nr:PaaI family thioesterase [Amycolatopsis acididurans]
MGQQTVDPVIAGWAAGFRPVRDGEYFPPHSPGCVGCGPANPHGLHLAVRRHGEGVQAEHTFDDRHTGAPGVAHGGAVAMAFDDLFGFLLYLLGELAVTRDLRVSYLAPVRLNAAYMLRADHGARVGRRIPVSAELRNHDNVVVATAEATFVVVDTHHFTRAAGR